MSVFYLEVSVYVLCVSETNTVKHYRVRKEQHGGGHIKLRIKLYFWRDICTHVGTISNRIQYNEK